MVNRESDHSRDCFRDNDRESYYVNCISRGIFVRQQITKFSDFMSQ